MDSGSKAKIKISRTTKCTVVVDPDQNYTDLSLLDHNPYWDPDKSARKLAKIKKQLDFQPLKKAFAYT
jgi:hypothetical protein